MAKSTTRKSSKKSPRKVSKSSKAKVKSNDGRLSASQLNKIGDDLAMTAKPIADTTYGVKVARLSQLMYKSADRSASKRAKLAGHLKDLQAQLAKLS